MLDVVIGIDPDIDKNGMAIVYPKTKEISLYSLDLGQLMIYLDTFKQRYSARQFRVYVEAGWLNKGNYHLTHYDSKQSAARKGVDQGRNHQRGIDIVELCKYNNIPVEEIKPLQLVWVKGKISHQELIRYMPVVKKKTNQEERDAALIAWVMANLPFRAQK